MTNPRLLPPGESGARRLYIEYQKDAVERGLSFDLTFEYFKVLTSSTCGYCDTEPALEKYSKSIKAYKSERTRLNSRYVYNGIDRVDPTRGYSPDNCLPCCKPCNVAKWDSDPLDFIEWARRFARAVERRGWLKGA